MIYTITFSLILSVFFLSKEKNKFTTALILIHFLAIILTSFINKSLGFYLYGFLLLCTLFYFIKISISPQNKYGIIFMIPVLIIYFTSLLNLINFTLIVLSQLISIMIFVYLILKKYKTSIKEISIMLPIIANIIIKLYHYFNSIAS